MFTPIMAVSWWQAAWKTIEFNCSVRSHVSRILSNGFVELLNKTMKIFVPRIKSRDNSNLIWAINKLLMSVLYFPLLEPWESLRIVVTPSGNQHLIIIHFNGKLTMIKNAHISMCCGHEKCAKKSHLSLIHSMILDSFQLLACELDEFNMARTRAFSFLLPILH